MEGRTRGDSRIRPKLLLVDDVPANLLAYRAILGKLGLDLHEAASGHEALSLVLRHEFAAILMDVQMPDLDGYETAELIREHAGEVPLPVIFITAGDRSEAREFRGYDTGAIDYLFKPVNDKLLISKVRVLTDLWSHRRRLAESTDMLRRVNGQLSGLLRGAAEGIFGLTPDGMIDFTNPAAARLLGVEPPSLLGQPVTSLFNQALRDRVGDDFAASEMRGVAIKDGIYRSTQTEFMLPGRPPVPVAFSLSAVDSAQQQTSGFVLVFNDISDQLSAQEALRRSAEHDELTGLPNRRIFQRHLERCVSSDASSAFGLLYLDLNGFKPINDQYGHDAGDGLLKTLGWRMARTLRGDDSVARLGGDEFGVVLASCTTVAQARQIADRLLEAITAPVVIDGLALQCGASIGIAMFPEHGADVDSLVRAADKAMYAAKRSRGESVAIA
ncbi:MAG: diguanylate cyclase [Abyssibacter sp.]|uniref:diguanylate cyclase domain-containing protein n=1 Tax=Abyssibacter sp. TaxID=2320200 RepID=UPI00321AC588